MMLGCVSVSIFALTAALFVNGKNTASASSMTGSAGGSSSSSSNNRPLPYQEIIVALPLWLVLLISYVVALCLGTFPARYCLDSIARRGDVKLLAHDRLDSLDAAERIGTPLSEPGGTKQVSIFPMEGDGTNPD